MHLGDMSALKCLSFTLIPESDMPGGHSKIILYAAPSSCFHHLRADLLLLLERLGGARIPFRASTTGTGVCITPNLHTWVCCALAQKVPDRCRVKHLVLHF